MIRITEKNALNELKTKASIMNGILLDSIDSERHLLYILFRLNRLQIGIEGLLAPRAGASFVEASGLVFTFLFRPFQISPHLLENEVYFSGSVIWYTAIQLPSGSLT